MRIENHHLIAWGVEMLLRDGRRAWFPQNLGNETSDHSLDKKKDEPDHPP